MSHYNDPVASAKLTARQNGGALKRKPWIIIVLAWIHILAPIGNLMTNAYWANIAFLRYAELYFSAEHFPRHFGGFFIPILSGICIYICRRWSLVLYFVFMLTLFALNLRGYNEGMLGLTVWGLMAVTAINLLVTSYFLIPRVRRVYTDARVRWWETKPRYQCDLPVKLGTATGAMTAHIRNFSETGILLDAERDIALGDRIQVKFDDSPSGIIMGQIVRQDHLNPHCYGVQFRHDRNTRLQARQLALTFHQKGLVIGDRVPGPEDRFVVWFKKLMSSGKGLVP